ncbi:MAG: DNA repair exonuclease [Sphaerochaetaceae bacterium]
MKIIACADLHVGRIPFSMNDDCLKIAVEKALVEKPEVFLIAGDLIDNEKNFYNSYSSVVNNLKKLSDNNIKVIMVIGNHDFSISSNILKDSPLVTIIGQKEGWDYFDYKKVRFIGWSFHKSHYNENPLENFDSSLLSFDGAKIGLLHCDLISKTQESLYAPVYKEQLMSTNINLWVLGHIHKSSEENLSNYFYCGSPLPLDESELGPHGIWEIEVDFNSNCSSKFIEISPVRIENYKYQLNYPNQQGVDEVFKADLIKKIEEYVYSLKLNSCIQSLYLNIQFSGVLNSHYFLEDLLGIDNDKFITAVGAINVYLRKFTDLTTIELDYNTLKDTSGPIGILASKILEVNKSGKIPTSLSSQLNHVNNSVAFKPIETMEEEDAVEIYKSSLSKILRQMLMKEDDNE